MTVTVPAPAQNRPRGPAVGVGEMVTFLSQIAEFKGDLLNKHDVARVLTIPGTRRGCSWRTVNDWARGGLLKGSMGSRPGGRVYSKGQVLEFVVTHYTVVGKNGQTLTRGQVLELVAGHFTAAEATR